jgi:hypothetical protein
MKSVFVLCLILLVELISLNSSIFFNKVDQFNSKRQITFSTVMVDCDLLFQSLPNEDKEKRVFQSIG